MNDLLRNLTDNQTALLMIAGGLGGSFLLLSASFYANPANREQSSQQAETVREQVKSFPAPAAATRKKAA